MAVAARSPSTNDAATAPATRPLRFAFLVWLGLVRRAASSAGGESGLVLRVEAMFVSCVPALKESEGLTASDFFAARDARFGGSCGRIARAGVLKDAGTHDLCES